MMKIADRKHKFEGSKTVYKCGNFISTLWCADMLFVVHHSEFLLDKL